MTTVMSSSQVRELRRRLWPSRPLIPTLRGRFADVDGAPGAEISSDGGWDRLLGRSPEQKPRRAVAETKNVKVVAGNPFLPEFGSQVKKPRDPAETEVRRSNT